MNLRLSSLRAMSMYRGTGHLTVAAALTFALASVGVGAGNAVAATGDAASAPEGASVSYAAGSQYTVKPGQSLNDVAIAVTQSRDRATLARASRALFDANPGGFMSHDPSRMRVGAVLTIPALDASGALVASAPVAGSASAAPSTAAAAAASTPSVSTAPAAPGTATPSATVGAASGVAQVNAAAASAASAAARAAAPSAPAVSGTASSAAEASPATPGSSTTAGAVATAPVAGSQAASGVPASGAHVWSGAVQPSASEAAEAASAAAAAAAQATATATAQAASQPRAQVSSLQQLLALKNRVLMELQKHGIGGSAAVTGTRQPTPAPSANGAQPAAGASSAAAVSGHGSAAISTSNDVGISQTNLSVAAAIGAALVVLLAALGLRRRKRAAVAVTEDSLAQDAAAASARAAEREDIVSTREHIPVRDASDASDDAAAYGVALSAAGREDAEREAAAREVEARVAAEREAEIRAAAEREAAERVEAERAAADQAAQGRAAAEHVVAKDAAEERASAEREAAAEEQAATGEQAAAREQTTTQEQTAAAREAEAGESHPSSLAQDPDASRHVSPESHAAPASYESAQPRADIEPAAHSGSLSEPLPTAHHENLDGATTAASLAAAAELGAEALPLTSLEPVSETFEQEVTPHRLQWDDEPASSASAAPLAASTNELQSHFDTPAPVIDFTPHEAEPHTTSPFGQPYIDTSAHSVPGTSVPAVPVVQQDTSHVDPADQPPHEPPQSHRQPHQQAETATPDGAPSLDPAPVAQTQPVRSIPTAFPRDAVDAFGGLNMPLPPRVESTEAGVSAPESLATQPVASPGATAQQAVVPHDPDDAPHISDEISAGTAGHAAVAGLGAAGLGAIGFGALKLDFDLELPPSPAQPLPAFTQADLSRIARNKLDLAAEYIDLGDLSGARLLINEVIEANDPATRTEARALLSTLAPLS
ncbi:fimbrial protein FimV [Paraburkholderia fungorum]|uniref:FimV/HubP family polar landmark protein n=1 Tax=Paraburkholderia fungorum TaxID=134537 RepID=UPI0038B87BE3